ncbi:hypothetical protein DVH02_26140 [Streptomyces corynorhini]|uniref:Secreted protein n=1 Tax=Streptomyces corynorhini TaxID=2282652 RepID=A0A370B129_9ACTN|nr:hypothetical protein DVH02_26140 [Streptomyces corynorhini]
MEGTERLRAAAATEPGRLRIIGAALALLVVAFGAVTAWEVSDRYSAAHDVVHRSQQLSADAAGIYSSLADADTAAASAFLSGAPEPVKLRDDYDEDIKAASRLLIDAASHTDSTGASDEAIKKLNEGLPVYTGLIEQARSYNRQGLPLGAAYLRYANERMTEDLLPEAKTLYDTETGRLAADNERARRWPYASTALAVLALGVLCWAQRRDHRRTNRVFNLGLVCATAASLVLLVWLGVGQSLARDNLNSAQERGQASLKELNDARIESLKARANENLTMVSLGAVIEKDSRTGVDEDKYEKDYQTAMGELDRALARAEKLADGGPVGEQVGKARAAYAQWQSRHKEARASDTAGDYRAAVTKVIDGKESTGHSFGQVEKALETSLDEKQRDFERFAAAGQSRLSGLAVGAGVLALVAAAGAVLGIGRRLSEYR